MSADYKLTSKDELTELLKGYGIQSWNELTEFVKNLPYGRNKNRIELQLVLTERKGTCSSKHAVLKKIADLNNVPNIKLILGIYRMNQLNTPKIGTELLDNSIEFIPEAHCYLKIKDKRIDLTTSKSQFSRIEKDVIEEKEIMPEQVAEFKVGYHQQFVKNWINDSKLLFDFDKIWKIRERCIANLTD